MPKIISFASQKGGVGKTTLLMLTAAAAHNRLKKSILVIDCDQQASVKHIHKKENSSNSYSVTNFDWNQKNSLVNFKKIIAFSKLKYDLIFLDLPSKNERNEEIHNSMVISDIIIIPIVASSLDIFSTIHFLNELPTIVEIRRKKGLDLDIYGIINKKDTTKEYKELHLLKKLAGIGTLQLFYTPISMSVDYKRKISTVNEVVNPRSHHEFNNYFDEFKAKCVF